jgi:hypothetical protein
MQGPLQLDKMSKRKAEAVAPLCLPVSVTEHLKGDGKETSYAGFSVFTSSFQCVNLDF